MLHSSLVQQSDLDFSMRHRLQCQVALRVLPIPILQAICDRKKGVHSLGTRLVNLCSQTADDRERGQLQMSRVTHTEAAIHC